MKVVIYSINYSPELIGIGKYNGEMAEWLAAEGHDVKVITAPPYYPEWEIKHGYSRFWYNTGQLNGVTVKRCPIWVPGKPSGLKRILHLFSFAITSLPVMLWDALFRRPDIVFVVEPPIFCAPASVLLAKLAGARSWLHVQDFEIDAAFDLNIIKSQRLKGWVSAAESWIMRRFDTVSTISDRMMDKLISKNVDASRTLLFENWVELDKIFPLQDTRDFRNELNITAEQLVVLYSGNMGEKQGLDIIVNVAERLKHKKDLLFLLCGDGSSRERLESMSKGLDNIRFLPLQPMEKLNELLNTAHIHLLPQQAGVEDLVMPSKLTNMLASGRPVVATVMPGTQVATVLEGCGKIVNPGDLSSFSLAIEALVDDVESADNMGKRGRLYVEEHWDINNILAKTFEK